MELEPGLIVREDMPLGERVSRDGLLAGYLEELDGVLGTSDPGLAARSAYVGDGVPGDLPAAYSGTVGVAAEAHFNQAAGGSQSQAGPLIDHGGNVDALRGAVLSYLPAPDAPIDRDFRDPPDGNLIYQGRGFNSIGGGDGGGGGDPNRD